MSERQKERRREEESKAAPSGSLPSAAAAAAAAAGAHTRARMSVACQPQTSETSKASSQARRKRKGLFIWRGQRTLPFSQPQIFLPSRQWLHSPISMSADTDRIVRLARQVLQRHLAGNPLPGTHILVEDRTRVFASFPSTPESIAAQQFLLVSACESIDDITIVLHTHTYSHSCFIACVICPIGTQAAA